MAGPSRDWPQVVERLAGGDALAFFQLSELITRILAGLRAYDFRSEWPDLVQEVAVALVRAHRDGRTRDRGAVKGFIHQITRNKFNDRLREHYRRNEAETEPLEDTREGALADLVPVPRPGESLDLRRALERLPDPHRQLVIAVYAEQKTYEEAAKDLGVPLGTAKRQLAEALKKLRTRLSAGEAER